MLSFVGLGLYDEQSITLRGQNRLQAADRVFIETYTSKLAGTTLDKLSDFHGVEIEHRDRDGVEQDPAPILDAAEAGHAAFVTAGDPMIATTHVDLRLRAAQRDIETEVIHGVTAQAAASSLTGLQNYRFGPATTLPFPWAHGADGVPSSVIETITDNLERDLHTLVFLDIKARRDEYMTADTGAELLTSAFDDQLAVGIARAGSDDPVLKAGALDELADYSFGKPLHMLVIPGTLHEMEAQAVKSFCDGSTAVIDSQ